MRKKHLNLLVPQWQGSGQDYSIYHGAFALKEHYLQDASLTQAVITDQPIGPIKNDIFGYDEILAQLRQVNEILEKDKPHTIFTIGGGCDADLGAMAYLNKAAGGDMGLLYIDAHGDLNTPQSSISKLFYGMSLRALLGDSDEEIVKNLARTISPEQLIMCANRALDVEEERYIREEGILSLSVAEVENDPKIVSKRLKEKGFSSIYIHIDLDALDPEEFPYAPVPEPNGLKVQDFSEMLSAVADECHIIGLGLLEYSGTKDSPRLEVIEKMIEIGVNL